LWYGQKQNIAVEKRQTKKIVVEKKTNKNIAVEVMPKAIDGC
jgi:hypothetical protein